MFIYCLAINEVRATTASVAIIDVSTTPFDFILNTTMY